MVVAAIQRFAILLALVGGVLHIEGVIRNNFYGLPGYGMALVYLSVALGLAGVAIELVAAAVNE